MRCMSLLLIGASLASCSMAPPPPLRTADGQRSYDRLLAGKVAGAPVTCVPNYRTNDMTTVDGQTLIFRAGASTAYLVKLSPGCEQVGRGNYALLTRQQGGLGLCRGEIAEAYDVMNRATMGSCVVEEITPFTQVR